MDRIRSLFSNKTVTEGEYAPLHEEGEVAVAGEEASFLEGESLEEEPFSWLEYFVFAMLGVAMLWAWYASPPQTLTIGPYLGRDHRIPTAIHDDTADTGCLLV